MTDYRRKHDRVEPRGWMSLFIRLGGWAALVLGLILVVLTLISAVNLAIADRLDAEGRFTQAVIMDKRFTVSTDEDGNDSYSYYATFRFKSAEGGVEKERSVGSGFYNGVRQGDDVTVRYVQSDPETFEYEIGQYRRGGTIVRWIGLVIGLGGLFTLWRFGNRANAAIKARRDGEKRFAEVTGIEDTNVRVNGKPQARLIWREPDGQIGKSLMRARGALSTLYRAGDKIVVFRLGDDAFWEGDVGPPKREMLGKAAKS